MRDTDLMELVAEGERRFDVSEWRAAGVQLWPLVRQKLAWRLNDANTFGTTAPTGTLAARAARAIDETRRGVGGAIRCARATRVDRSHRASTRHRADAVLLGDNVSRIQLDGAWYDRFCEPMIEGLTDLGLRSLHLEPHHVYRVPRSNASARIQPRIDALLLKSAVSIRDSSAGTRLPGYDEFLRMLEQEFAVDPSVVSERWVTREAHSVALMSAYFGRLLARARARIGVVVDYGAVPMSFHRACRQRGIPSVELQHGGISETHWAYASWDRIPKEGYELLPSHYWTWSEQEADVIRAWARHAPDAHRALVGGNPWLNEWVQGRTKWIDRFSADVRRVADRPEDGLVVLHTMQWGQSYADALEAVAAAIEESPSSWRWAVRTHPVMSAQEVDAACGRLAAVGVRRGDIDRASTIPLYALLRSVDVHVTHSSSTVVEAEMFGVPSVATHAEAAPLYPDQARRGWLVEATSGTEIVAAVARQAARAGELPRRTVVDRTIPSVLEEILRTAGPASVPR